MRPRLLDLYCCQGGAAMGYYRAGFDVTGVDIKPQPRYPFTFVQADALAYLAEHGHEYDAVHGSPPCQDHTVLRSLNTAHGTGWLLDATRSALRSLNVPWVMENVAGADMPGALTLCGSEFGLGAMCRDGKWRQLRRHRKFESSPMLMGAGSCHHRGEAVGVYGHGGSGSPRLAETRRGYQATKAEGCEALGIDWMDQSGLAQSIPPAYTQFIGEQLMAELGQVAA